MPGLIVVRMVLPVAVAAGATPVRATVAQVSLRKEMTAAQATRRKARAAVGVQAR